tara:strand:+ start:1892 stop:2104 length:213 start_codon:yes stop_codon:yes gene_type:complete
MINETNTNTMKKSDYPQTWQVVTYALDWGGRRYSDEPKGFYNVIIKNDDEMRRFFESFDDNQGQDVHHIK